MKLLIVNNLASGFRDGAIYDFMRAFASDGDEICVRCTDGDTDLADFLRDAEDFDAVVAAGGTVAGVVIAGLAATLFSLATGITGWNVSDIESLLTLASTSGIQVGGLLFSGLLISSLGAVMDVAMSIASAIAEIHVQNPALPRRALFRAGMHVGRDMMGTDSNTLILAFAGGSISMLVLDYAYNLPYRQIINSNNIGIAIMQGLSGSFGIVLAVPVTVALAVLLYTWRKAAPAA